MVSSVISVMTEGTSVISVMSVIAASSSDDTPPSSSSSLHSAIAALRCSGMEWYYSRYGNQLRLWL
jgi:hypothetical protein